MDYCGDIYFPTNVFYREEYYYIARYRRIIKHLLSENSRLKEKIDVLTELLAEPKEGSTGISVPLVPTLVLSQSMFM